MTGGGGTLLRRLWPRRAVVLGASAVLVVGLGVGAWIFIDARKIPVPNLVGLDLTQVEDAVAGTDLRVAGTGAPPDEALLPWTAITSQTPPAGDRVFPGHAITYTAELVDVQVPDIVGSSFGAANAAVKAAGLGVGDTSAVIPIVDDGRGPGLSASTDPSAIEAAAAQLGVKGAIDVTGAPFPLLAAESGKWGVVDTKPAPGTSVKAGTTVKVTVAAPLTQVPDVVGQPYTDAAKAFEANGLAATRGGVPHFSGTAPTDFSYDLEQVSYKTWGGLEQESLAAKVGTPGEWLVHAQAIPAGQIAELDQVVDLTVEWPAATMPDLTGKTQDDARQAMNNVGLSGHAINGTGFVRSQLVAPGTVLPMGVEVAADLGHEVTFRVTSTVSRGSVTWAAPNSFSIEQDIGTSLPWSKTWSPKAEPDRYSLGNFNAQMNGSGSITCEIVKNGEVIISNTSTGAYAVVSCG